MRLHDTQDRDGTIRPVIVVSPYRRPLLLLVAVALAWMFLTAAHSMLRAGDGLVAEYFTNAEWNGFPALSVVDAAPSTALMVKRWKGAPPERFSVRWRGFLAVATSGEYRFSTTSDDGSELVIDDMIVVDNAGFHGVRTVSGRVFLERGPHRILLKYSQMGAATTLDWRWSFGGGDDAPIPRWLLSQRRTGYATTAAARIIDFASWGAAGAFAFSFVGVVRLAVRAYRRPLIEWADSWRRAATAPYADGASFLFSVLMFAAIMVVPWPDAGHQVFLQMVRSTAVHLATTANAVITDRRRFQQNINKPHAGEQILPVRVQEMLAMIRARDVDRYSVSPPIVEDAWGFQQIVGAAWPRKLEQGAKARFVLNVEPFPAGCDLVEKQTEVSLVYCR
jgi:hypothetical protein